MKKAVIQESRNKQLCNDSGTFTSSDPLTDFLYHLMRDHISVGVVEEILRSVIETNSKESVYTNGWLAQYAQNIADTIRDNEVDEHTATMNELKAKLQNPTGDGIKLTDDLNIETLDSSLSKAQNLINRLKDDGVMSEQEWSDANLEINNVLEKQDDVSNEYVVSKNPYCQEMSYTDSVTMAEDYKALARNDDKNPLVNLEKRARDLVNRYNIKKSIVENTNTVGHEQYSGADYDPLKVIKTDAISESEEKE